MENDHMSEQVETTSESQQPNTVTVVPTIADVMRRLDVLPYKIESARRKIADLSEARTDFQRALDERRNTLIVTIAQETRVNDDGKEKPAFPNQSARDAELERRLNDDDEAARLIDDLDHTARSLERARITLARHEDDFKAARSIARLFALTNGGDDA